MNLVEMKARLAEIVAKLAEFEALDSFESTDVDTINNYKSEFETLKRNIEAKESIEAMKQHSNASAGRAVAPARIEVNEIKKPNGGFASIGEFFKSVAKAKNGQVDKRLTIQNAGAKESVGEDGGYLIPDDFRSEVQKKIMGDASLLPRTKQYTTAQNHLVLPTTENAPWDGSGVTAYWESEGGEKTESKPVFGQASYRLNKLSAIVRVTDELLEDAPALESYIRNEAPDAFVAKINKAIIDGSGVGMPLGFLRSGFAYSVAKESAQTADTVVFANIVKMYSHLIPSSIPNAAWIIHPQVMEQLRFMKFNTAGTPEIPAYLPPSGLAGAPYGTLLGLPIIPMMAGVKALGDVGDISLVDLRYYTTALKSTGIKSDVSIHCYFTTDETAFRFNFRMGGGCSFKSPIVTENGSYNMSGFVTLAERA